MDYKFRSEVEVVLALQGLIQKVDSILEWVESGKTKDVEESKKKTKEYYRLKGQIEALLWVSGKLEVMSLEEGEYLGGSSSDT